MGTLSEIPDCQVEGLVTKYVFVNVAASTLGAVVYMVGIQRLLLTIHYSKIKAKNPHSVELLILISVFWIVHRLFDLIFSFLFDYIVSFSISRDSLVCYTRIRQSYYPITYWITYNNSPRFLSDSIALLFNEVLATWLIFKCLILFRDILIPWGRKKPEDITLQLQIRYLELLNFFQRLYDDQPSPELLSRSIRPRLGRFRSVGSYDDPGKAQYVSLKRHQDQGTLRTLSWDVNVSKQALDEMKETLGPPGGFGEVGFTVAGDKVVFGAMGVGTRFNLTFVVEQEMKRNVLKEDSRRKSWMD